MSLVGHFLDALPIGVAIVNQSLEVFYHNRALASFNMAGESKESLSCGALLGCPICADGEHICGVVSSECVTCPLHIAAKKAFAHRAFTLEEEILWFGPDVSFPAHIQFSLLPLQYRMAGEVLAMLTWEDFTRLKLAEEKLKHDAFHDDLTGLSNRALFMDRLRQCILRLKRHGDHSFAVLSIDIDRFKVINDGLGHPAGDQLLIVIGRRLRSSLRSVDTVARLGGDEYAILLEDIRNVRNAMHMADQIQRELNSPVHLVDQEILPTASIGIAMGDPSVDVPEDLLRRAEMAMYRAKRLGRARHVLFDTEMHDRELTLLKIETDMRRALERQEFMIYYQPFVEAGTGRLTGVEALLRWRRPRHGMVPPDEFIPVAEESGLIVPIGDWVLLHACEQNRAWQVVGLPRFPVAVNLSGRQFRQRNLLEYVPKVLESTGLEPCFLELEITEGTIMENAEANIKTLNELHEIGVRICIDDFGTGYSSLAYLKRFPIDTIKIDKSFVRDVNTDPDSAAIVEAIIAMARSLQIRVIAEGVETREQLEVLRTLKCNEMQGHLFCRPASADALVEILRNEPGLFTSAGIGSS
jgi:diguanylate cyclase (GGDEF)-like protein